MLVEMLEAGAMPCLKLLQLKDNSGIRDAAAKEALTAVCRERGVKVEFV